VSKHKDTTATRVGNLETGDSNARPEYCGRRHAKEAHLQQAIEMSMTQGDYWARVGNLEAGGQNIIHRTLLEIVERTLLTIVQSGGRTGAETKPNVI
jgi:hypothetical protein